MCVCFAYSGEVTMSSLKLTNCSFTFPQTQERYESSGTHKPTEDTQSNQLNHYIWQHKATSKYIY